MDIPDISQDQIERLSEMKLSRMDREYRACITATRQTLPLPDSKSAGKEAYSETSTLTDDDTSHSYYSRLPSSSFADHLPDHPKDNSGMHSLSNEEVFDTAATTTSNNTSTVSNTSSSCSLSPTSTPAPPSIAPLSQVAASTIKSLMSGMNIAPPLPPRWLPETEEGEIDAQFDQLILDRISYWGKKEAEDYNSFTTTTAAAAAAEVTGTAGPNTDDMDDWVATFSSHDEASSSTTRKKKKKKKKEKGKKKKKKQKEIV